MCLGPDRNGAPTKLADGSYVFSFNRVWSDMDFLADKITRPELSHLLVSMNATWWRDQTGGKRNSSRMKRVTAEAVMMLRSTVELHQPVDESDLFAVGELVDENCDTELEDGLFTGDEHEDYR